MGYWAVYKIQSGNVIERYKAWKSGTPGKRGKRVKGSSPLKKIEQNKQGAARRLARVLNANFTHADFLLTMTYDDDHLPADWENHEKDRSLMMERIKKRMKRLGLDSCKWVSMCSDRDGKTGDEVRRHVHVVISGEAIRFENGTWQLGGSPMNAVWGKGSVYVEQLWDQDDYTGLAVYLLRQARRDKADWKAYHTSRNLVRPVATEDSHMTSWELRAPKGAKVLAYQYDARSGNGYIRYVKPKKRGTENDRTPSAPERSRDGVGGKNKRSTVKKNSVGGKGGGR